MFKFEIRLVKQDGKTYGDLECHAPNTQTVFLNLKKKLQAERIRNMSVLSIKKSPINTSQEWCSDIIFADEDDDDAVKTNRRTIDYITLCGLTITE